MIRVLCLMMVTLIVSGHRHRFYRNVPSSPCPNIFKYIKYEVENRQMLPKRWYGVITLSTNVTLQSLWLKVVLDGKADILGSWIGEVSQIDNNNFVIENPAITFYPNDPRAIYIFVQYRTLIQPKVKSIYFNGIEICNATGTKVKTNKRITSMTIGVGSNKNQVKSTEQTSIEAITQNIYEKAQNGSQTTETITSEADNDIQVSTKYVPSIFTNSKGSKLKRDEPSNKITQEPSETQPTTIGGIIPSLRLRSDISDTSTQSTKDDSKESNNVEGQTSTTTPQSQVITDNEEEDGEVVEAEVSLPIYHPNLNFEPACGKVIKSPPLELPYGSTTSEGQWPWQVALYHQRTVDLKYICGGTLISTRHVITAAHCVTKKKSRQLVQKKTLTVYLGKFNLKLSIEGVQVKFVNAIKVHPEFNATNYVRDIAILELRSAVTITDWVRPICLWPDDEADQSVIVGIAGSVVGWGFEDSTFTNSELRLAEMPVLDQETCFKFFASFFDKADSDFMYCANYKQGTETCFGNDSGGGMVFKRDNTWYLRGIAAVSISLQNERSCETKYLSLFTDVAKFLPWIRDHIDITFLR